MKTTLSANGQIAIPAKFLEQDGIEPGQQFEVQRLQAGKYLLKKIEPHGSGNLLDWLKEPPEKDWFAPIR